MSGLCILGGICLGIAGGVWFLRDRPWRAVQLVCIGACFVIGGFFLASIEGNAMVNAALAKERAQMIEAMK